MPTPTSYVRTTDDADAISPGNFTPTTDPAVAIPFSGGPSALPSMSSTFTPAFIELTGAGPSLATLNANAVDAAAGRILQGVVNGELKNYQVRVGDQAQDLPGIVRPANFHEDDNAVLFVQL